MTVTRNPSRKYFKRNQPYFYKSADNWEEWDTDESYDRTFFIGVDDTNPADIDVALYMIWGGKPVAVVGSKVLDTVSSTLNLAEQLETEIQSILKEVQELSAKVAQSTIDIEQAITEMNALVDRCEGILDGAEAARDLAKDWANKMNGTVDGTEYSAKYYANEAKNSETAATEQATAASTSANQAATSASTAASYASSAHIDASGAANSAKAAASSESSAHNYSGSAYNSAGMAKNSATSAANSETNSANSANASAASANNSHIWAEGTDAQVAALGGVHSSKGWAQQSTSVNISLTNTPYTTNRILEIPQDIKLELNNGTLTLKAGSKLYYPDGFESDGTTPKFFEYIVPNDYSFTGGNYGFEGIHVLSFGRDQSGIDAHAEPEVGMCYSGTTAPTGFGQYAYWWDLSINRFKWTTDSGSTWNLFVTCLPVALFHYNGTNISGIDQVFNGFGYIGNTVFALPGVQVQIPNGRNEDGTCKATLTTLTSVKTQTFTDAARRGWYLQRNGASSGNIPVYSDTQPSQNYIRWFSQKDNQWYDTHESPELNSETYILPLAVFNTDSTGKITSFEPYTVDSVVNSNEFYQLKDKAVTTDTTQTISGSKLFTQPSAGMSIELVADTNQQTIPATATVRQLGLYRNATYSKGDGFTSWIEGSRGSNGWTVIDLYTRRFLESDSQEIINYLRVCVTSDGVPVAYTKTPPAGCVGEEIVTAGWFRQAGCTARTVIETYRKGTEWYRIWSDGWIEQGGFSQQGAYIVNFLKPFTDANYTALCTFQDGYSANTVSINDRTNTGFTLNRGTAVTDIGNKAWYACGY